MPTQFGIRTALLATAIIAIACVVALPFFQSNTIVPSDEAKKIVSSLYSNPNANETNTQIAIAETARSNNALVFLDFDWSMTSAIGTLQFAQFVIDYSKTIQDFEFEILNITSITNDYSALEAIPGWAEIQQSTPRYPIAGNGEIDLIIDQKVVHVQPS